MTTFSPQSLVQNCMRSVIITTLACFIFSISNAQSRSYSIVYSDNIKGGSTIFGNTLMQIIDHDSVNTTIMNDNSTTGNSLYGNNKQNMQYADIDGSSGAGSATRNSSSADLFLPAGINTIKLARLYWGGLVINSEFDLTAEANKKIKIRKGTTGNYLNVTASGIDKEAVSGTSTQYQAYADVTAFVKSSGAGTYEIGNVPLSTGALSISGADGGWCIVVVYENENLSYNSIRFYDGFQRIYDIGNPVTTTVTLTGLNVPSGSMEATDAKMGVVTWEGDANLKTDFLKINGNLFSNAVNPSDNPWNGTISTNGAHVTTKNPNYTNQMGLDIDQFNVGTNYGILPGNSQVTLQFGAEADRYFPGAFTFTIKMKDPVITLNKTVTDANNNNLAEIDEVITYRLTGKNIGVGNANSVIITDTLPSTITYLPNSLRILDMPGGAAGIKTDALGDDNAEYIVDGSHITIKFRIGAGSNGTIGGMLATNDSFQVEFKATVNDPGAGIAIPSIMNIARIKATSDANVEFVDDATAIINSIGGPLPINLVSFNGILLTNNTIKLDWSTAMELNCKEYRIERSMDGKIFSEVSAIDGSGTTNLKHYYFITDDVTLTSASIIYYRLKQIDLDKKGNYSKVIAVKLKTLDKQLNISPNPFTSYLNINMEWSKKEVITINVINVQGKEVIANTFKMAKGLNYISIAELSKLSPGNYFIQFNSSTERVTRKITKQ